MRAELMRKRTTRFEYIKPYSLEITSTKHSWVVIRSSSDSGLGYGSGASVLLFVVGRRFFNSCFKWLFVVAGESCRCLEMRSSVSPEQVVR